MSYEKEEDKLFKALALAGDLNCYLSDLSVSELKNMNQNCLSVSNKIKSILLEKESVADKVQPVFCRALVLLEDMDDGGTGDLLSKMERIVFTIITGGDEREQEVINRRDRLNIRNSIALAAKTLCEDGRGREYILIEDIARAMKAISDEDRGSQLLGSARSSDRMAEMLGCIRNFCEGLVGNYVDFIAISKKEKSLYCPV